MKIRDAFWLCFGASIAVPICVTYINTHGFWYEIDQRVICRTIEFTVSFVVMPSAFLLMLTRSRENRAVLSLTLYFWGIGLGLAWWFSSWIGLMVYAITLRPDGPVQFQEMMVASVCSIPATLFVLEKFFPNRKKNEKMLRPRAKQPSRSSSTVGE